MKRKFVTWQSLIERRISSMVEWFSGSLASLLSFIRPKFLSTPWFLHGEQLDSPLGTRPRFLVRRKLVFSSLGWNPKSNSHRRAYPTWQRRVSPLKSFANVTLYLRFDRPLLRRDHKSWWQMKFVSKRWFCDTMRKEDVYRYIHRRWRNRCSGDFYNFPKLTMQTICYFWRFEYLS